MTFGHIKITPLHFIVVDCFRLLQCTPSGRMKTGVGTAAAAMENSDTTTLSTIAVQSGGTKLVIALLQSGPKQLPR